jgi:Predicted membrane protein
MIMVAKVELQTAADAAAFAGARALNGSASANLSGATAAAVASATSNSDLGVAIRASEVTVTHGAYHYDYTTTSFSPQFPPVAPDNYNLTQVTIVHDVPLGFAKVWNLFTTRVSVTAIAAHRPRDVCIILDYSGSMNNESDLWNNESYLGTANNSPNNADPIFPKFGPYDPRLLRWPHFSAPVPTRAWVSAIRLRPCWAFRPWWTITSRTPPALRRA